MCQFRFQITALAGHVSRGFDSRHAERFQQLGQCALGIPKLVPQSGNLATARVHIDDEQAVHGNAPILDHQQPLYRAGCQRLAVYGEVGAGGQRQRHRSAFEAGAGRIAAGFGLAQPRDILVIDGRKGRERSPHFAHAVMQALGRRALLPQSRQQVPLCAELLPAALRRHRGVASHQRSVAVGHHLVGLLKRQLQRVARGGRAVAGDGIAGDGAVQRRDLRRQSGRRPLLLDGSGLGLGRRRHGRLGDIETVAQCLGGLQLGAERAVAQLGGRQPHLQFSLAFACRFQLVGGIGQLVASGGRLGEPRAQPLNDLAWIAQRAAFIIALRRIEPIAVLLGPAQHALTEVARRHFADLAAQLVGEA